MTRKELEDGLDVVVIEAVTLSKKDRDRLVDLLADHVVEELGIELDEEVQDEEEE